MKKKGFTPVRSITRKRSKPKLLTGFTLIELLLVVGFLVFAVSASLLLFANCILLNKYSRSLTVATSHAQYVMEEIKNQDFSTIETSIDSGNWDWGESEITTKGLSVLDSETIDTNEVGTTSDLLNVVVTVNWTSQRGRAQSLTLETLIVEP